MQSSAPPSAAAKPAASTTESCWTICGRQGHDPRPGGLAAIDLDAPAAGVRLGAAAESTADHLLCLDLDPHWRLADHWARGADLTAVYESNDARHLRATAMWRLTPGAGGSRGWQAIVSAQTALLQSDSILAVTSTLRAGPADTWLWGTCSGGTVRWQPNGTADATCLLLRRRDGVQTSVLVAGHPGEVRRIERRPHGERTAVMCWLFSTTLEKGVLLRSRVLAAVGPAQGDEDAARDLAAEFAALPPEAVVLTKALLHRTFELDLESFLFEERAGQALLSTVARDDTPPPA